MIDLAQYEQGFEVAPGYTEPVVDIGGNFPCSHHRQQWQGVRGAQLRPQRRCACRGHPVDGASPAGSLEVFPATVGNPGPYGSGVTDGFRLIMVLGTEGRLFASNSSAGGIFFPKSIQLNHEMPLVAAFSATECYGGGEKPNFVSMDYIYVKADSRNVPI